MKKLLVVVIILIAVVAAPPLVSRIVHRSGPRSDTVRSSGSGPVASDSLGPGVADEAITLWAHGRTEQALSLLLEGKRTDSTPITPLECLSISEAQFGQVPAAEMSRIAEQCGVAGKAARDLARAAIARVKSAQGDRAKAARWRSRLTDFAAQLAGPKHPLILQLVGQAISKKISQEFG